MSPQAFGQIRKVTKRSVTMTLSSTYKNAAENSRHSANNFRDAFDEIITWYFASEGAVFLLQAGLDLGGCLLLPFTLIGWIL